jgi:hypothetical protein
MSHAYATRRRERRPVEKIRKRCRSASRRPPVLCTFVFQFATVRNTGSARHRVCKALRVWVASHGSSAIVGIAWLEVPGISFLDETVVVSAGAFASCHGQDANMHARPVEAEQVGFVHSLMMRQSR